MTAEQMRTRMLNKIQEKFDAFKAEEGDIVDIWCQFIKFKTTIELALSLELISMGEYLKYDTDGDYLYHEKREKLNRQDNE